MRKYGAKLPENGNYNCHCRKGGCALFCPLRWLATHRLRSGGKTMRTSEPPSTFKASHLLWTSIFSPKNTTALYYARCHSDVSLVTALALFDRYASYGTSFTRQSVERMFQKFS